MYISRGNGDYIFVERLWLRTGSNAKKKISLRRIGKNSCKYIRCFLAAVADGHFAIIAFASSIERPYKTAQESLVLVGKKFLPLLYLRKRLISRRSPRDSETKLINRVSKGTVIVVSGKMPLGTIVYIIRYVIRDKTMRLTDEYALNSEVRLTSVFQLIIFISFSKIISLRLYEVLIIRCSILSMLQLLLIFNILIVFMVSGIVE